MGVQRKRNTRQVIRGRNREQGGTGSHKEKLEAGDELQINDNQQRGQQRRRRGEERVRGRGRAQASTRR